MSGQLLTVTRARWRYAVGFEDGSLRVPVPGDRYEVDWGDYLSSLLLREQHLELARYWDAQVRQVPWWDVLGCVVSLWHAAKCRRDAREDTEGAERCEELSDAYLQHVLMCAHLSTYSEDRHPFRWSQIQEQGGVRHVAAKTREVALGGHLAVRAISSEGWDGDKAACGSLMSEIRGWMPWVRDVPELRDGLSQERVERWLTEQAAFWEEVRSAPIRVSQEPVETQSGEIVFSVCHSRTLSCAEATVEPRNDRGDRFAKVRAKDMASSRFLTGEKVEREATYGLGIGQRLYWRLAQELPDVRFARGDSNEFSGRARARLHDQDPWRFEASSRSRRLECQWCDEHLPVPQNGGKGEAWKRARPEDFRGHPRCPCPSCEQAEVMGEQPRAGECMRRAAGDTTGCQTR